MRAVAITGYTCRVERQLKERLTGAAVLVAIAVLLVPEMFSGPRSRSPQPVELDSRSGTSEAATEQIKTMQIDLQRAPIVAAHSSDAASSAMPDVVEPPAPAPKSDEPEVVQPEAVEHSMSSRAASSASSPATPVAAPVPAAVARSSAASRQASSVAATPAPPPKPELVKPAAQSGTWQVQIGSFGTEARAREIAAQLKARGHGASISPLKSAGKTLYRVRVAGGNSRESAEAVLKKLSGTYAGAALVAPGK